MIEHPADDLVAYALGELRPAERRAVDAHLDSCAACRAEAAAIGETVWEVAATAARDVPPGLRDAVVGRARSASRAAARPRPGAALWTWLLRPVPAVAPLALGALLLVALVAVAGARQDADRYARLLGAVAGAQVTPLAATAPGAALRGSLVVPADGTAPYLILDLPAPPAGKTWEAWVIRGDVPVRAGTTGAGAATLRLEAPLRPGDTVAITPEPAGGVDRPTGVAVLVGRT